MYLDGPHAMETISYIVVEAGRHTLPDGTVYDAGHLQVGSSFMTHSYSTPFTRDVVTFTQIVTD
jgi:hypothetical protein